MRIRTHLLPIFGVAVVAGGALLHISQMVQNREDALRYLEQKIAAEQEAIRVLEAEWAYLNSPARLEELASEYLSVGLPDTERMYVAPEILPVQPKNNPGMPEIDHLQERVYHEISLHGEGGSDESEVRQKSDIVLEAPSSVGRQKSVMTQEFSDVMRQSKTDVGRAIKLRVDQVEPAGDVQ